MTYFLERLQREIAAQVKAVLHVENEPTISLSNPKVGSDVAVPCFVFAKDLGKSPQAIASEVAGKFQHDAVERTEAVAGFVNFWLKPQALVQCFADDLLKTADQKIPYGEHRDGAGQTAIVDFPSVNMAKPFSVGHLRPSTQGWAVAQLLRAMGYTVIGDNHLGDWGTPFGKWATGFHRFSSEEKLARDGVYELARIYIKMTAEMKYEAEHDKHELADEAQAWLLKLEQGEAEATALSKRFNQISLDHIHAVMTRFGIHTEEELGESFYIPEAKKLVAEFVATGVAVQQTDGSVIAPLADYGIETPALLQKSNGTALYITSDIACIKYRLERWQPAKIVYPVDMTQKFHFTQLFALADKVGYKSAELVHPDFGLIDQLNEDGSRSKMSSRKGVVLLEDLLDKAEARARKVVAENKAEGVSDDDIKKVALGAIKFTDFAADRRTGMLFDWNRMFSLQGYSGPYVQYAGVRVSSILRKLGAVTDLPFDGTYDWTAEKELLLHLLKYPLVVREAAAEYEPHRVAQFAYELARLLNRYYEEVSIAKSEVNLQHKRLWLLGHTQAIHAHALDLLGIEVPSKM